MGSEAVIGLIEDETKLGKFDGSCAILGFDIVAFSVLSDDDQIKAIQNLYRWINESLANHSISKENYRWSPAGDGGYLTFSSSSVCRKAIDVAFTLCDKVRHPDWKPASGSPIRLRLGLHAGLVKEDDDLGRRTNIWGVGIKTAKQILAVTSDDQLLVSRQYYDEYISGQRNGDFEVGDLHWRTLNKDAGVEVMNVNRHDLCLSQAEAENRRWQAVGGLWKKTIEDYSHLINDAMRSGDPVAAMASAKFLLELNAHEPVMQLCHMVGRSEIRPTQDYPPQHHILFSQMPPEMLFKVIENTEPRLFKEGEIICEVGDPAASCFFPISGTLVVDLHGRDEAIPIEKGQMTGEFSLWIPNISRTGRVRALDDGLFLEIHIDRFRKYLDENPDVATVIYGIIKRRIVANALTSKLLFPGFFTDVKAALANVPATAEKHAAGTELDLRSAAYAIFSGKVEVAPPEGINFTVESKGQFRADSVVGIVSEIGEPDGDVASVVEETVAVRLPHDFLEDAQRHSDAMTNVWNAICGQRLGQIQRAKRSRNGDPDAPRTRTKTGPIALAS